MSADELLATWDSEQTPLEYWCDEGFWLEGRRSEGQCVVHRVSDTEIALNKPSEVQIVFRSSDGFVVERCLASYLKDAFQVHIRTPDLTAWLNLKPLSN